MDEGTKAWVLRQLEEVLFDANQITLPRDKRFHGKRGKVRSSKELGSRIKQNVNNIRRQLNQTPA